MQKKPLINSTTFMIKALLKLGMERLYLNIMKALYDKPIPNIILNGEKLKPFCLKSGMREGCLFSSLLFNLILEFIASAMSQKKK
jgi:hypothetical protein